MSRNVDVVLHLLSLSSSVWHWLEGSALLIVDELLYCSTATARVRFSPMSTSFRLITSGESFLCAFGKHL